MLIEAELTSRGKVRSADIGETSLYDRAFRKCVLEWVRGWELPKTKMRGTETVYVPIRARFPLRSPEYHKDVGH
jgi:hypothetical protein